MFEASSERGSAKRCPEYGLCLLQPAYHGRRHSAPGQAGLPVTGSAAGENFLHGIAHPIKKEK